MKKILIAALLGAGMTTGANAATIFSSNFDNGLVGFTTSSDVFVADGSIYNPCCGTDPTNTNKFAAFDAGNNGLQGVLTKAFTAVAGRLYTIAFDYGAIGGGTDALTVSAGGVTNTYSPAANSSLGFTSTSFSFVGTGAPALLSFTSAGTFGADAIIDNVSITAVPEASTWAMMIAGFGVVGGALRVRGRKVAVAARA